MAHLRHLANKIELLRRCGLMPNYFDHLLLLTHTKMREVQLCHF